MKQFKFKGEWKFDMELPILSKINSEEWYGHGEHNAKLESGRVPVEIADYRDLDPDPKDAQLAAIDFIINHEDAIIKSLVKNINGRINKLYVDACGDEEWVKKVHNISDIGKMIGLGEIRILHEVKDNVAYYVLFCEYTGDHEHGLTLTMYKDELIGFEGSCEVDYDGLARHAGGFSQSVIDTNIAANEFGKDMIHIPNPKYKKLKPWQDEENQNYCYKLIRQNENQKLIDEIDAGNIDVHYRFVDSGDNLLDIACGRRNYAMIDYFIAKGVSLEKSIYKCVRWRFDEQMLRKIVEAGAQINTFGHQDLSPFLLEIKEYASALIALESNRNKNQYQFDKAMERSIQLEERLPLYIELGVDPLRCTVDGKDYKSLLLKTWTQAYFDRHKVFEKIDALLFPSKNPAWKIW